MARASHEKPDPKNGFPWDQTAMEQARVAMRVKTDMASLVKKLDGYRAYCPSKSPAVKLKGAFIVLGTIMKLR
jgi:hypothetical protein